VSPHILEELRAVLALPKLRARSALTDAQVAELLDANGRQAEAVGGILVLPENWRSPGGRPRVPAEDVPRIGRA